MRRGRRERLDEKNGFKKIFYLSLGGLGLVFLVFAITFAVYNNKLKQYSYSSLSTEKIADLVPNIAQDFNTDDTEEASNPIGKTIEQVIENEKKEEENDKNSVEEVDKTDDENEEYIEEVVVKKTEFINPVEGEILRSYAKDSLIYSNTLEEWIVHLGIDIKAERTTVVKAAESRKNIFNKK